MKKRLFAFILITSIFTFGMQAKAASTPAIKAEACILIDQNSGNILYEKNKDVKLYPASITKILTALIALERGNLNETITVDQSVNQIEYGSSNIGLLPGEKVTLEQLLYGLMLESGNDCANVIAMHFGKSIEGFADLMNQKAREVGALHSHFTNPHGLHNKDHYVTAQDMALITKKAMENPFFQTIVSTVNYEIPSTNLRKEMRHLSNHNRLVNPYRNSPRNSFFMKEATGTKTGYTTIAQQTLVSSASRNDSNVIAVVLKAPTSQDLYKDSRNLLTFGLDNFIKQKVVDKQLITTSIKINAKRSIVASSADQLQVGPKDDFYMLIDKNKSNLSDIHTKWKLPSEAHPPVNKGDILGSLEVYNKTSLVGTIPVMALEPVQAPKPILTSLSYKNISSTHLFTTATIVVAILTIYFFIRRKRISKNSIKPI